MGLEPGVQYMVGGGLIAAIMLTIIACTICYMVRMKNKGNSKVVKGQHVVAMTHNIDEDDVKDASEIEITADDSLEMHDREWD